MHLYDTDATHCVLNTTVINQQREKKCIHPFAIHYTPFSESTGLSFAVRIHQSRTKKRMVCQWIDLQNNEQSEEINKANNSRGWLD